MDSYQHHQKHRNAKQAVSYNEYARTRPELKRQYGSNGSERNNGKISADNASDFVTVLREMIRQRPENQSEDPSCDSLGNKGDGPLLSDIVRARRWEIILTIAVCFVSGLPVG